MKTLLIILFVIPILAFGQVETLKINSSKAEKSYLNGVLINKKLNIGIFSIHYSKGRVSHAYFYVIDFNKNEILSSFNFKNWTYLYNSWVDNDTILHLSKGFIFTKKVLVDLKSGSRITAKKNIKKQSSVDDNNLYIDSQELYCSSGIVYWNGLEIFYDDNLKSFRITSEK